MSHPDHDPDVGDVEVLEWTPELALRAAGQRLDRAGQVAAIRDAVDDGTLSEEAVDVLIAAGWTKLEQP